ncbi:MAG TPA: cation:proton antiporter subunit C [Candidatus Methanoperedenaceae archaeon]|nr:cation:proton antiporter subunit C [Candidatus Methanoperedenaceae archaeon]
METVLAKYNYVIYVTMMMIGFYGMIGKKNLIKKCIGINIFQYSLFLFFISMADINGGTAPIIIEPSQAAALGIDIMYVNPLPHVLILTAIVVCVSTTAVALSLVIRIHKEFGTIEEDKILQAWSPGVD